MKISVLGLGAYGIALAKVLNRNGNEISMWSKFDDEVKNVSLKRENKALLPGIKIPKDVEITTDMKQCLENAKIVIIAVPSNVVRDVSKELSNYITTEQIICIVSKGIENTSNKFMSEVVFEETKNENICYLSGPSFAKELASGKEQGLVVASKDSGANLTLKICLENDAVFVNTTKDIIGVQIASAVKNVFAILLGICDGAKYSDSTRAAILTCVVTDLRKIIELLGGKSQTIFSYAGIGDLLLTTMSSKSRNYTFGKKIGEGKSSKEAQNEMEVKTVEGLYTLNSIYDILDKKQVEIKSVNFLNRIINGNAKFDDVLRNIKN